MYIILNGLYTLHNMVKQPTIAMLIVINRHIARSTLVSRCNSEWNQAHGSTEMFHMPHECSDCHLLASSKTSMSVNIDSCPGNKVVLPMSDACDLQG